MRVLHGAPIWQRETGICSWCEICVHMGLFVLRKARIERRGWGIRDLRAHGIHCTSSGANLAVANGHLEVVRDLQAHGIPCTESGANLAALEGHFEIVEELRAHGILCLFRTSVIVVRDWIANGYWGSLRQFSTPNAVESFSVVAVAVAVVCLFLISSGES